MAVRNSDGGFFLCQAMQNVYKSSPKIHIRWLDERNEGAADASSEARTYDVAFFDTTDFECVLTTVELDKVEGKIYELPKSEQTRIESILKKAIDVEKGIVPRPAVTEENPDGRKLHNLFPLFLLGNSYSTLFQSTYHCTKMKLSWTKLRLTRESVK